MGFYTARWPGHEIIIIFFYSSSFTVALKNLKPFDTEEEKELVVGSALVSHTMNKKNVSLLSQLTFVTFASG